MALSADPGRSVSAGLDISAAAAADAAGAGPPLLLALLHPPLAAAVVEGAVPVEAPALVLPAEP